MPLAEHDNVVKTFPPDRTDRPFTISVLPRRSRRGWPIPNAHRPKAARGAAGGQFWFRRTRNFAQLFAADQNRNANDLSYAAQLGFRVLKQEDLIDQLFNFH